MKTVVITGSSRGLGWEMARCFRKSGMNVVLNGVNSDRLQKAKQALEAIPGDGKILVAKILKNKKNNVHIQWLTTAKVMRKFFTAGFNKRDFFS